MFQKKKIAKKERKKKSAIRNIPEKKKKKKKKDEKVISLWLGQFSEFDQERKKGLDESMAKTVFRKNGKNMWKIESESNNQREFKLSLCFHNISEHLIYSFRSFL